MRKEELERRTAELKDRILSQRSGGQEKLPKVAKPRSIKKAMPTADDPMIESVDDADIATLRKRIAELEKENERLRQEVPMMSARSFGSERSSTDSVREQRHNFFKYSNIRRY